MISHTKSQTFEDDTDRTGNADLFSNWKPGMKHCFAMCVVTLDHILQWPVFRAGKAHSWSLLLELVSSLYLTEEMRW